MRKWELRFLLSNDIKHTHVLLVADIKGMNMEIRIGTDGVEEQDIEKMQATDTDMPNAMTGVTLTGGIISIVAIAIIEYRASIRYISCKIHS
jgi:hypothetical protein